MKLKKILAVTLCLSVAFPLAACKSNVPADTSRSEASGGTASESGEAPAPEKGATLTFRTGGVDSDLAWGKAVAEKFKEKYGVSVTVQKGTEDNLKKAKLEAVAKSGADVFMLAHDLSYQAIVQGILLPFDNSIVQGMKDAVSPVALKTVTKDGKVYGAPVSVETSVLFYNKKLVKTPATTFEEIFQKAKTYNDAKQNKFWFLFNANEGSPLYPLLSTYGYNLFGADGTDENKPNFDTPEFLKGLQVIQKFHLLMPMKAVDSSNTDFLNKQFTSGKAGYIMSGPWDVKTYEKANVDFGVIPIPTYDGKQPKVFSYIQNAHVASYTKYPKAAQLFAQFLVSNESAELLYSKAGKITARKDVSKVSGLSTDPISGAILEAFQKSAPMPSVKRISYFWTVIGEIGPEVFDEKLSPEDAQKKAVSEWNSLIQTES
ncbi:sugar ABC transporter substrate-binding protein [Caproicibacter fermentans]|uniref:Maltose ABC transporter substrate-binding protein n=1 Tax=Caproicibacter fermentans TaxID=2576756 RepID=A0A7G8TAF0_9FIRM|nr:maltose ABC transporter substrate-binding protein [Caproicibacter fermentans]QNK40591.1 maltose ABC transporter substrate-binding protein [Caproicibacter fermentans]